MVLEYDKLLVTCTVASLISIVYSENLYKQDSDIPVDTDSFGDARSGEEEAIYSDPQHYSDRNGTFHPHDDNVSARSDGLPYTSEVWGEWGEFTRCSASCGHGVRVRYRKCVADDSSCHGDQRQEEACLFISCPNNKADKVKAGEKPKKDSDEKSGSIDEDGAGEEGADDVDADDAENPDDDVRDRDEYARDDDGDFSDFSGGDGDPVEEEQIEAEHKQGERSKPNQDEDDDGGDNTGADGDASGFESHGEPDREDVADDNTADDDDGDDADSVGEDVSGAESDAPKKKKGGADEDEEDQEEEDKDEEDEKNKKKKKRRRRRKRKKKAADTETSSSESSSSSSASSEDNSSDPEVSCAPVCRVRPSRLDLTVHIKQNPISYGATSSPNADIDDDIQETDEYTTSPGIPSPGGILESSSGIPSSHQQEGTSHPLHVNTNPSHNVS